MDTFWIGVTNLLTLAGLWKLFGVVRPCVSNLSTLVGLWTLSVAKLFINLQTLADLITVTQTCLPWQLYRLFSDINKTAHKAAHLCMFIDSVIETPSKNYHIKQHFEVLLILYPILTIKQTYYVQEDPFSITGELRERSNVMQSFFSLSWPPLSPCNPMWSSFFVKL